MILDRVDYSNIATAFKLRGYSKCSSPSPLMVPHKGPDLLSKEKEMIERAKQRRREDAEQAKIKLAKKEATARIRQFEDQRRKKKDFEVPIRSKPSEASDVDSAICIDPPEEDVSQAEMVSKIVSKWRAKARWSKVIRHARSMSSSGNSNATPSKHPSPAQPDLLSPVTPTRTRASSTGSIRPSMT